MKLLAWLATFLPAFTAAITVGRVTASLDAPTPFPHLAAIATALLVIHVLDTLIGTLLTHRAARRG
ncbi:hypothetical protein O3Q52_20075 [Streptomyces sp. ActVer]|uniref:hypothetical protein n=1 Tax=Streptomyces sp. ActVer TaxID=3014558 RepID=UPI0022B573A9|nr:hypothetical protein [Streptomyces sp. ActVer]MCZ4510445.1 hypothetical protein [Streptomyces sp. ActVer]